MGIFIEIKADDSQLTDALRRKLVAICPVDIFVLDGERLIIDPEQEDECTLCALCLEAAPVSTISIRKLYSGEILQSHGATTSVEATNE